MKNLNSKIEPVNARFIALLCLFLLHSTFCFRAEGQSYSIDWHTIDGGGGTSTGAVYSVTGTIGQPDAGVMSGGQFTVQGGFWGVLNVVQTEGAPLLKIAITSPSSAAVYWPSPSTGFQLQTNSTVATTNWGNYLGTVFDNGSVKSITNSPPKGNLFFRLKKQ